MGCNTFERVFDRAVSIGWDSVRLAIQEPTVAGTGVVSSRDCSQLLPLAECFGSKLSKNPVIGHNGFITPTHGALHVIFGRTRGNKKYQVGKTGVVDRMRNARRNKDTVMRPNDVTRAVQLH